jgi:two-component system, NtrC family, C4-dicarboxylate transport sensor histidine kinase DctB
MIIPPRTVARTVAQRRQRLAGIAAVLLVVLGLAGFASHRQALEVFLDDTARRGDTTLRLAVATLQGQLQRFERLPSLIADHDLIRALAADPDDSDLVARSNLYLRDIAGMLGASDIYLMDVAGTTRAASNFDTTTSFVGGNFAFRPYFRDAVTGGVGRFFALGTTSRKRGYYFGAPVRAGDAVRGVVVFKVDLDAIEDTWRGGDDEIIVTDPEGIVFLSSTDRWLFRPLAALTPEQLGRTLATRRYADAALDGAPLIRAADDDGQRRLRLITGDDQRQFLKLTEPMPEAGWSVSALLDTASAERQAITVAVAVMLALGLGSMALAVVVMRRTRLRERLVMQQAARDELERRVTERTAELAAVNARLEAEVAERTAAEANLRQAQADLVQAGKMAALGQMSAALSHEFNQPLAAARNYADNALVLMDRDRMAEARGNIGRILSLIDRLAAISRHLRSFARTPESNLRAVDLAEVVAAAEEIAGLRLRAAGADLTVSLDPDLPRVVAGPVRLQQVLVNLITNAADAVEGAPDRRIVLRAMAAGPDGVRITIRDHGPGVAPGLTERIFDPFFSTKGVGKGLGLGLSISYNIIKDFGGGLSAANVPDGGAEFCIDLRAARPDTSEAA